MTEVNPLKLFGNHENCADGIRPCFVCDPKDELSYIMMVGAKFYPTPEDFMSEARKQGISKRIPFIPKKLKLGQTIIYLAHPKACEVEDKEPVAVQQALDILAAAQPRLVEAEKKKKALGIFTAFIPQRLEKMFWESERNDELLKDCEKKGITPVFLKDGDPDHK